MSGRMPGGMMSGPMMSGHGAAGAMMRVLVTPDAAAVGTVSLRVRNTGWMTDPNCGTSPADVVVIVGDAGGTPHSRRRECHAARCPYCSATTGLRTYFPRTRMLPLGSLLMLSISCTNRSRGPRRM